MTATSAHTGTALPGQELHCFVCDVAVTGRYYTLATCRTQLTKVRLIEKLGQLVGEKYMVVISEDDIICRGCATLINTLDRLESEMGTVRSVVLQFLEKKYSLEEGELVNSKPTGAPGQPPQITPSTNPARVPKSDMNRKRKAVSSDGESDGEWNGNAENKKKDKSSTWMQCNKCKYTTDLQAFMVHHVRTKKKQQDPSKLQENVSETNLTKKIKREENNENKQINSQSIKNIKIDPSDLKPLAVNNSDAETVEMIAAEISSLQGTTPSSISSSSVGTTGGTASIVVTQGADGQLTATGANNEEVTIDVSQMVMQSDVDGNAICMMPIASDGTGEGIEGADDGNLYVHVVDISGETVGHVPAGSVETVGRVNPDGTVEMVEVMWENMVADNAEGDQGTEFTL